MDSIERLFPHDNMREAQRDGIETLYKTASDNAFLALEGACGTGKTALALTPLVSLVKDEEMPFSRVFAITSVKQQIPAFEEELQSMDSTTSITLVGKGDINPYARNDQVEDEYEDIDTLKENTREIIESMADGLDGKLDAAKDLCRKAETGATRLPYGKQVPEFGSNDTPYSPYYAKYLSMVYEQHLDSDKDEEEPVIDISEEVVTTEVLYQKTAVEHGISPHPVMSELMLEVDVIVGNYYHAFDETTIERLTGDLISSDTLLVCDEAHNLVPRVRGLLSDEVSLTSLSRASNELQEIVELVEGTSSDAAFVEETARNTFAEVEGSVEDLRDLRETIEATYERFSELVSNEINGEGEVPLRDPSSPGRDKLSEWFSLRPDNSERLIEGAERILEGAFQVKSKVYTEHRGYSTTPRSLLPAVGRLLTNWLRCDNTTFYREISIERAQKAPYEPDYGWQSDHSATLRLRNCIPSERIADRITDFGGGVLMSATLAPFDVFKKTSGLDKVEKNGRKVQTLDFGLPFPEENRKSLAVCAQAFKGSNRGQPRDRYGNPNLETRSRKQVAQTIIDGISETEGSVLVGMPSYEEAKWARDVVVQNTECGPVFLDEQSSNEETENLKVEFFEEDSGVLFTSVYGTLVEGVDYQEDKLSCAIVCGVPYRNSNSPYQEAILAAYNDKFGSSEGFKLAFTLPAVYKVRQTIGRVIRSEDDRGVRVLVDERYCNNDCVGNVSSMIPEIGEFEDVSELGIKINEFWGDSKSQ